MIFSRVCQWCGFEKGNVANAKTLELAQLASGYICGRWFIISSVVIIIFIIIVFCMTRHFLIKSEQTEPFSYSYLQERRQKIGKIQEKSPNMGAGGSLSSKFLCFFGIHVTY